MRTNRNEFMDSARGTPLSANDADECRTRAIECSHNAFKARDDLLSSAYLQLAHHWRAIGARAVVKNSSRGNIPNKSSTRVRL